MDKKNKNPNVPNLRFSYKGDWSKRKLNEICLFFKGNGLSKSDLSNEGFPCILYGELYTTYKNEVISKKSFNDGYIGYTRNCVAFFLMLKMFLHHKKKFNIL